MLTTIVAPNKELVSSSSVPETKENAAGPAAPAAAPADAAIAITADSTIDSNSSEIQFESNDFKQVNLHPPPKSQPHSPQTSHVEDDSGCEQMEMSDQIMELMRREALRHLEFAWEAERNLTLLCQDQQSLSPSDKTTTKE